MRSWFHFKRPSKRATIISALVLGSLLLVYGFSQRNYGCDWTGLGKCLFQEQDVKELRLEKTLWDWLGLLIVPAVLALGAVYFNWSQRRNELEIAQAERRNELEIAEQRAQDALLQTYLDQMTDLLLDRGLRNSQSGAEVRHVAQTRTLIALRRLDQVRRTILMQFLRASRLVGFDEAQMIVDFRDVDLSYADLRSTPMYEINLQRTNLLGADLRETDLFGANLLEADCRGTNLLGANLFGANLQGTKLQEANLQGADLFQADLTRVNLEGANLQSANLEGANLQSANLEGTNVTPEQLTQAASLKSAIMPNGEVHP